MSNFLDTNTSDVNYGQGKAKQIYVSLHNTSAGAVHISSEANTKIYLATSQLVIKSSHWEREGSVSIKALVQHAIYKIHT